MGQDELVLKIPAPSPSAVEMSEHSPSSNSGSVIRRGSDPRNGSTKSSSKLLRIRKSSSNDSGCKRLLTHSRESSGASVKFEKGHRRTLSKSSDEEEEEDGESRVIIMSPSEDLTISDRLSNEDDDIEEELKKGCEEDFHERIPSLGEDLESMSRDPKSQNSDYGSFCNTPPSSDVSSTSGNPSGDHPVEGAVGGIESGAKGGPDKDVAGIHGDQPEQKMGEDQSVMANDSYQRQPLLDPSSPSNQRRMAADSCSSDDELGANSSGYTRRKSRKPNSTSVTIDVDETDAVDSVPALPDIPAEPLKTLLAFVFLFFAWVATTTSLALTHERVPDIDPLPDVFLDNVHYQSWGLDASEIIIMIATLITFTMAIFHQHRFIVLRRIFFLGGIHYFYRAITMYITVLPKADPNYKCAPKLNELTFVTVLVRVLKLLSGMGLSINGQHIYCGDYIYSGHTMTLLMTYLIIDEYSPRRWFALRWASLLTTITGVLTLLFARGHYTIDVLIAYWITHRLWCIYHTMANNPSLMDKSNKYNYLSRFWWSPIFRYLEGNVGRPLPKGFNWPLPVRLQRRIPVLRNYVRTNSDSDRRSHEEP